MSLIVLPINFGYKLTFIIVQQNDPTLHTAYEGK